MRHLFAVSCEQRGPFLIVLLKVNRDVKHDRATNFKSISVSEKASGKLIFKVDQLFPSGQTQVEDCVRLIRRVGTMIESEIRVEGVLTINKKTELAFETSVQAIIAEDSQESSFRASQAMINTDRLHDEIPQADDETAAEVCLEVEKVESLDSKQIV